MTKERDPTHTVDVRFHVTANSQQHAEIVVANSVQSAFYEFNIINND